MKPEHFTRFSETFGWWIGPGDDTRGFFHGA